MVYNVLSHFALLLAVLTELPGWKDFSKVTEEIGLMQRSPFQVGSTSTPGE